MSRRNYVVAGAGLLLEVLLVALATSPEIGAVQIAAAIFFGALYVVAALLSPVAGFTVVALTIPYLGLMRRLLYFISPVSNDVLLLVLPAVSALAFIAILVSQREKLTNVLPVSRTSRLVGLLILVLIPQILNPLQGGISVGVGGVLFYLVPLTWYFIGRIYLDAKAMQIVLGAFLLAGLLSAGYGLMQTYIGFPEFDSYWVSHAGYASLQLDGTRPFGTTTSAAEFAEVLACSLTCLIALLVMGGYVAALIPAIPIGLALILESSRTFAFQAILVTLILLILRQRSQYTRLLVAAAIVAGVFMIYTNLSGVAYTNPTAGAPVQGLVGHQVNGLLHPFDRQYSTGTLHANRVLGSFWDIARNPLGYGLGATTTSAYKFGGNAVGVELDVPNVFLSGGVLAGVLYVMILYRTAVGGARLVARRRRLVDALAFTLFITTLGQTLNGGYYSMMPFVWLSAAWIDYRVTEEAALTPAPSDRRVAGIASGAMALHALPTAVSHAT